MTSREKFEAWYLENWGHTEDDHETLFERDPDSDEEYYRLGVRMAHGAWQASELASQQKLTDMAVQLANAESKCRELAAESAGLKEVVSGVNSELYGQGFEVSGWHLNGALEPLDNWFTDNGWGMPETPATDAFLAEVRAQGVELFAASLKVVGGHEHPYSAVANDFAAQLRKGAKS